MTESFDVAIAGAGIAGLTAALRLAQRGLRVVLLEAASQPGGVIQSEQVGEHLLEYGPNTMAYREGDALHRLIAELGISAQLLSVAAKEVDRYIWSHGRLRRVPLSPFGAFTTDLLPLSARLRAASGMALRRPGISDTTTVGQYFRERLGPDAVNLVLQPAMSGIFAADVEKMSLKAALPRLHARLTGQPKPPLDGAGPRRIGTFPDGLHTLPLTLAAKATEAGATIHYNTAITSIEAARGTSASAVDAGLHPNANPSGTAQPFIIRTTDASAITASRVILTTAAHQVAPVLANLIPMLPPLLKSIPYAPLTVAHVSAPVGSVGFNKRGFGFLAARGHGVRSLGILWPDQVFDGARATRPTTRLFTCFIGGETDPASAALPDAELLELIRHDLSLAMDVEPASAVQLLHVTRRPHALPLYHFGNLETISQIQRQLPANLHLLAAFTGGPSLYDRVVAAENTARKIVAPL